MVTVASVGSWRRETERFRRGEQGTEEVAERPSQATNGSARDCVFLKPERTRTEQSEQRGRRGAWRRGEERVLVPADSSAVSSRHLRSVFTKLNVLSRTEAITAAFTSEVL